MAARESASAKTPTTAEPRPVAGRGSLSPPGASREWRCCMHLFGWLDCGAVQHRSVDIEYCVNHSTPSLNAAVRQTPTHHTCA